MQIPIGVLISRSGVLLLFTAGLAWPQAAQVHPPIIDMHLHAHTLSTYGASPPTICTNDQEVSYPAVDPRESRPLKYEQLKSCRTRQSAPSTDEQPDHCTCSCKAGRAALSTPDAMKGEPMLKVIDSERPAARQLIVQSDCLVCFLIQRDVRYWPNAVARQHAN